MLHIEINAKQVEKVCQFAKDYYVSNTEEQSKFINRTGVMHMSHTLLLVRTSSSVPLLEGTYSFPFWCGLQFGALAIYRKMRWDLVAVWVTIDAYSSYESGRSTKMANLAESE